MNLEMRARLGLLRTFGARAAVIVLYLLVFGWAAGAVHETFHYLVARQFGATVHFTIGWSGYGHVSYVGYLNAGEQVLFGLAGGLGAGLVMGLLWLASEAQVGISLSEVDSCFSLAVIGLTQVLYAPIDAFVSPQPTWAFLLIGAVALLLPGTIYWRRLVRWLIPPA